MLLSSLSCLSFFSRSSLSDSFSKDVPKDYRHMSLTGVKQRFEDEAYQHISKEKVSLSSPDMDRCPFQTSMSR